MKVKSEQKEVIVGYEAYDGQVFSTPEACMEYENTAIGVAERAALALAIGTPCSPDVICPIFGCFDEQVRVFSIKNAAALQVVNTFLGFIDQTKTISPSYIGRDVIVQFWLDHDGFTIHGTREELEAAALAGIEKLFAPMHTE